MRLNPRKLLPKSVALLCLAVCAPGAANAQTQAPTFADTCSVTPKPGELKIEPADGSTSGVRIEVKGADGRPVRRKRFFLLERSAKDAAGVNWGAVPRRENFLAKMSPELKAWLEKYNCETVFCPEIETSFRDEKSLKELLGAGIPEFREAYALGMKRYRNERLAGEWMLINFPLRAEMSRYFDARKNWLRDAEKRAGSVKSALTDDNGQAYFTDVPLKTYYVSNLLPLEGGDVVWNCPVAVLPPRPKDISSVTVTLNHPRAAPPPQPAGGTGN